MSAQCLSVCGPCKELCKACIDSYNKYVDDQEMLAITDAIRVLESRGYQIQRPQLEKV